MNQENEPLVERAEEVGRIEDQTQEGEHIRVVRYQCPRCDKRAVVRISAALVKSSFRCVGCGYVIVV